MVVPVPPKSHSATTPLVGRPGSACNAVRAAAASETRVSGLAPDHSGRLASSRRKPSTAAGRQWAGYVTAGGTAGLRQDTLRVSAHSASATNTSPRWKEPSAASTPTGSPDRSTKPVTTSPRSASRGFSDGTPTSGGRCRYKVSTDWRVAAAPPATAATLVAPTDSPTP